MKLARRGKKGVRIEMLPLIDIVFLLLVFFIYAMLSMAVHRGLVLDLPESSTAGSSEQSPLSLSIKRVGTNDVAYYLDDRELGAGDLERELRALQEKAGGAPVLVFAEEGISYQQLYATLDLLKRAGVLSISLQANRE
ncbi:ExbD/TolR family protein [Desulfofustis glycolicus]|uniref:Biopolymer transport protein ExbD n=1 Tax=Desulfofustis glycolicus DSM 9705 TaxID=1121409 RepID=A0A1M5X153_9BACT|nr:biopolymer transporter ExbD [Desulfofustis glycolicus]MCB2215550.1 biopolymer transporter ExbD [Desulfobulbaceae bacterium]SHH93589.1 biopolymer transport protein ExbD [Desulfofustis glycolicus DSM 9705]